MYWLSANVTNTSCSSVTFVITYGFEIGTVAPLSVMVAMLYPASGVMSIEAVAPWSTVWVTGSTAPCPPLTEASTG